MKIIILGSGSALGVPVVGCSCGVCVSDDKRNHRMRASIFLCSGNTSVLIDSSTDLRMQMLNYNIKKIDAVLYTHAHADHCHGIDDLRQLFYLTGGVMPVYASPTVMYELRGRFSYLFNNNQAIYKLNNKMFILQDNLIQDYDNFNIGSINVQSLLQRHGKTNSNGFIINNKVAYCTDVMDFPQSSLKMIKNIELLIIDCTSYRPTSGHFNFNTCIDIVTNVIKPERAFLTHMSHEIAYQDIILQLPEWIRPVYDGMEICIS